MKRQNSIKTRKCSVFRMNSGKKRKRSLNDSELNSSIAASKLQKYAEKLLSSDGIQRKTVRHMKSLLIDSKDDADFLLLVRKTINERHLVSLLTSYNATDSKGDAAIFDLLFLLERTFHISFRKLAPLVWGERSKENYENLRKFGQSLHNRLTSDQVLDYLDPRMMWHSLLHFSGTSVRSSEAHGPVYDTRFVLRLLVSLLDAGSEMSNRKFVETNALSYAFASTSLQDRTCRSLGYVILKRFFSRLTDLTVEKFEEKSLFVYLIRVFRNSLDHANQRLPHAVSHFFARTCKLLLHPDDPVYSPILSFLVLKPTIDMDNIPELFKLLMSSSTEHHREERHWILKLISESMIEPNDYNVLQKRYGIKLCLSIFASNTSDMVSRKLILLTLNSALRHPSVAYDLFQRQNFHSWIALTIQQPCLTRWEVIFLCQLFVSLLEHLRNIRQSCPEKVHRSNKSDGVGFQTLRLVGKKVLEVIGREDDEGKAAWFEKLESLLNEC